MLFSTKNLIQFRRRSASLGVRQTPVIKFRQFRKEKMAVNFLFAELKRIVIEHYGNKCACCGETNKEFFTIDHINNDGSEQREDMSGNLYRWIVSQGYPTDLQILCWNCNCCLSIYGYCPHRPEIKREVKKHTRKERPKNQLKGKRIYGKRERKFFCTVCGRGCATQFTLKTHTRSHALDTEKESV